MKITNVEVLPIDRYLFVHIHTDAGIIGLGESGTHAHQEAAQAAIEKFGRYLVGEDPARIEHHWNVMYRSGHFRGAAIMGAISAIDIALWDIKGKALGVPVYDLLGGKCREKARVYYHVRGATIDDLLARCIEAKERGFTAVGHLSPFLDEPGEVPYFKTHTQKIRGAIDTIRRCREAVGDEVDLCVEIHRRLTPAEAVVLARGIEPFHPMFYEDPILPDNFDAMGLVAQQIAIPLATGERLHTIQEFQMLLTRGAVQYVRPDVCLAGGISGSKKIAALAEAHNAGVVPHNPNGLSPVSTAACLQIAACIPNLAIQEYSHTEHEPPKSELVKQTMRCVGGFLIVPDAPGIGIELAPDAREHYPPVRRTVGTRLHVDGSVVDQ
jgi:galactonate dehydratase